MRKTIRSIAASAAAGTIIAAGTVLALALPASANHSQGFTSGTQHITLQISCSASETIVSKISGANVGYAARSYGGRPGHWLQGSTVFSGNSYAIIAQRTNSGVHVFGTNYVTGC
jgi:hypothetical protein